MISQGWIDGNAPLSPDGRLLIVLLPVVCIVTAKSDITVEDDEVRSGLGNSAHQCLTDFRVGVFGVGSFREAGVPVNSKAKGSVPFGLDLNWLSKWLGMNFGSKRNQEKLK